MMKECVNWKSMNVDKIYTACHAGEAKEIIATTQIDVIICDIEMPGENGLDLMRWLQQRDKRMIRILLTCHESFNYVVAAIRCGVFAYLLKPFDMEELIQTMEQARKVLAKRDAEHSIA